jgi:hypothetical protein
MFTSIPSLDQVLQCLLPALQTIRGPVTVHGGLSRFSRARNVALQIASFAAKMGLSPSRPVPWHGFSGWLRPVTMVRTGTGRGLARRFTANSVFLARPAPLP